MSGRFAELACYVPGRIARRPNHRAPSGTDPTEERFPAVLLFADVSGYTPLANRLEELGAAGADKLAQMLNAYYGPLVEVIQEHGGDVIRFAGDALLALWPAEHDDLDAQLLRAAQAGLAVQSKLDKFAVAPDVELSLRISLAAGAVRAVEIGGVNGYWQLLVFGDPLDQIRLADKQASVGDVVLSPEAYELVAPEVSGEPLAKGAYRLEAIDVPRPVEPLEPPALDDAAAAAVRRYVPPFILSMHDAGLGEWVAELRRVSVVFVQLTGLEAGRDSAAAAHQVMRRLQSAAFTFGGMVLQLVADDKGIVGVLGFGLPQCASEEHAVRSLYAAWAIQDQLKELGLGGNIGVATGRAFCGPIGSPSRREYAVMGSTVNLAARLMQCSQGDILCNDTAHRDAESRLKFHALPRFQLKGLPKPVPVFRSFPPEAHGPERQAIIGRTAELNAGAGILRRTQRREHCVLIVEGEPGIGKSAFVDELLALAPQVEVRAVVGEARTLDRGMLYAPWRAALSALLELDSLVGPPARTERVARLLESAPPALRGVASLLNPLLTTCFSDEVGFAAQLAGRARSDSLHSLVVHLIQAASRERPSLIVLDDAQWLDSASWGLALQVHRNAAASLMFAMRPLASPLPEELEEFQNFPGAVRLSLNQLDRRDTADMAANLLGVRSLSEDVIEFLHAQTEGNPFFLEELTHYLRETGRLAMVDGWCRLCLGGDAQEGLIPSTVRELVTSRIDQLQPNEQLTIKVASVIGRIFALRILGAVHPVLHEQEALRKHLEGLVSWDMVRMAAERPELRYLFKHVIIQQVSYDLLPQEQRRRLHRAIAEWYETLQVPLDDFYATLAFHWGKTESRAKEIEYLTRAGAEMLNSGANREAGAYYATALERHSELVGENPSDQERYRRGHWERQLGEARFRLGDLEGGRLHLERALELLGHPAPRGLGSVVVQSAVRLLVQAWRRGVFRRTPQLAGQDEAAPEVWDRQSVLRETLLAEQRLSQIHYFRSELPVGVCCALRALERSENIGHFPALARAYANMCIVMSLLHFPRWADQYARLAVEVARRTGDYPSLAYALSITSVYRLGRGQWKQVQADADEGVAICERLGDHRRLAEGVCVQAMRACYVGEFENSIGYFRRIVEISHQSGNVLHQAWGVCGEGECQFRLGRREQAQTLLEEAEILLRNGVGYNEEIRVHGLLAAIHTGAGRTRLALQHAERAVALSEQISTATVSGLEGLAGVAEAYFAAWEADLANRELRQSALDAGARLQKFARTHPVARPRACLYQGMAKWLHGRPKDAHAFWRRSLEAGRALNLVMETSLTHLEIGRRLSSDDPAREQHLRDALAGFRQLHMAHDIERVQAMLSESTFPEVATRA